MCACAGRHVRVHAACIHVWVRECTHVCAGMGELRADLAVCLMSCTIYSKTPGDAWSPSHVKPCDIIFVKVDFLQKFFQERHKQINATYILISHNGYVLVLVA